MSATVLFNDTNEYATVTQTFTTSGTPADPTTVSCVITDPTGAATTHTYNGAAPADITKVSIGKYQLKVACTVTGIWSYRFTATVGTSLDNPVSEGTFTVNSGALTQLYCSAEELKSRLSITSSNDDSEIALAIAAASRAVDGYCDRYFFRTTETRTYVPTDLYRTRVDDLVSVTTLATDPAGTTAQGGTFPITWPTGSYQLLPYNPGKTGEQWPYTSIRAVGGLTFPWVTPILLMRMDRVQVTGVFGWPAIPQPVRTATLIAAAELFRMKDTPMGGGQPGEFAVATVAANPRIGELLAPYSRTPFLAA